MEVDPQSELGVSWVSVLCAGASAICCTLVLLLHVRRRALSRFPSSLLLWRIVCDLVLSLQILVLNLSQLITGGQDACTPQLAFLAQFGLLGSLGWYACLSLNLYFSVTRPFTRPAGRTTSFHTFVWLGAVSSGIVAAAEHGYRPLYHTCWPHVEQNVERTSYLNWGLFFFWVSRTAPIFPIRYTAVFPICHTPVFPICHTPLLFSGGALLVALSGRARDRPIAARHRRRQAPAAAQTAT